ncbi:MAG: 23S rRNA (adenine(2503)-C(2))-methyltransferase RlmN [Eubacterium sp.]|nr:23S rRNA (adenine(2503)-C(2))-methyltransferase RlmN [Eubacterium sp.]
MKQQIRNLTPEELKQAVTELGQPAFRAKQLMDWIYKGKTSFREMHNLPEVLILALEDAYTLDPLTLMEEQVSKLDGTRKYLFGLEDGNAVESVFLRYKYGNSVCISSQAGCRMGCRFCASGINGLVRNLTAAEMLSQIMDIERITGEKVGHVVVMGTGEPFDNYENLARFLRLIHEPKGFGLSYRNITVSTCGLVNRIERFSEEFPQVNLAISLHAATDEERSRLMPVNRKYPLSELIEAARKTAEATGRRVTFEYALIHGENDTDEDAQKLAHLLHGMLCHVNLIPLNAVTETGFQSGGRQRAAAFSALLEQKGIPATVRRQMGADIDGACGQLRLKTEKRH